MLVPGYWPLMPELGQRALHVVAQPEVEAGRVDLVQRKGRRRGGNGAHAGLLLTVDVEVEAHHLSHRFTLCQGAGEEDGMRVLVNRTLCESNAVCARLVPEVFLVDDEDRLQIKQERPPEALRERVEHAVRRCPKLALSIVED